MKYYSEYKSFGVFFYLENFNKEVTFRITLLNFKSSENISNSLTKNWKNVIYKGSGFAEFIKFDDFINKNYLFEDYYVASFIVNIV
jgi:hypothetical protein